MKIRHYSLFNKSDKEINWNHLREDEREESYFMPKTKEQYIQRVKSDGVSDTIIEMIAKIKELGCNQVFSLGSGIAQTEYQIATNSDIDVIVSDNTSSIETLKTYEIFKDCLRLDIMKDDFKIGPGTMVLLHRIDTEFDDKDLMLLFAKLAGKKVDYICFVPTNPSLKGIFISELKVLVLSILKFKRRTLCGFSRSKSSLLKLWKDKYKLIHERKSPAIFYILERSK